MGISCSKEYTLTVNSGLDVNEYWTMEETAHNDRVGKVADTHLVYGGGAGHLTVNEGPGVYGNSLQCHGNGFVPFGTNPILAVPGDGVLALKNAGNGFSLFCWVYISNPPDMAMDIFVQFGTSGNRSQKGSLGWNPEVAGIELSGTDSNGTFWALAPTPPPLGVWFFGHIFYNQTLGKMGVQINNGAPEYTVASGLVYSASDLGWIEVTWPSAAFSVTDTTERVDEMGIITTRMLTPTEVTFLYNSGAGRTWPL